MITVALTLIGVCCCCCCIVPCIRGLIVGAIDRSISTQMISVDIEHKVPLLHSEDNYLDWFPLPGWSPPYPDSDNDDDEYEYITE